MTKSQILEILEQKKNLLRDEYDVESIGVFGSAMRNELAGESDIDIFVRFRHGATFRGYFKLLFYLEELLGRKVDLATDRMVKPKLWDRIKDDLTYVA